ncbi:MAG: Nif3-like dinuclear metal center hexameric protein [Sphaerochaetaceae bacterium]|nr:Nif3-like dinuclear metal center hexameric protein [Sphaerochaetaceae bacterium]
MNIRELEDYISKRLHLPDFAKSDISLNGLQVGRREKEIRKVVTAVDASLETFRKAHEKGADALFVHHGLFWGKPLAVRDEHYERIAFLLKNDIALFAAHLPLDAHSELGNNATMASILGLTGIEPFGEYHGIDIGFSGSGKNPLSIDEIAGKLGFSEERGLHVLPFGPEKITRVAIVSGGAAQEVQQAIEIGADAYITGEASHTMYSFCKERKITMICGGHYQSEVFGVQSFAEALQSECAVKTEFIDIPTSL